MAPGSFRWLNEAPAFSEAADGTITITAGRRTDFWRKTHYGFIRDSGNFYFKEVTGNFTAEVTIVAEYSVLYDQAGLMVRLDDNTWIKTGIEYFNSAQHVSAVVTRDFSDWAVAPLPTSPPALTIRVTRTGGTVEVFYRLDSTADFELLRVARLTEAETVHVGLMVASPEREEPGFEARFEKFQITRAQ